MASYAGLLLLDNTHHDWRCWRELAPLRTDLSMVKDIGLSSLQADEESNRNTTPLFSYLTPNSSEEVPKPILCPVINPQKMISLQRPDIRSRRDRQI